MGLGLRPDSGRADHTSQVHWVREPSISERGGGRSGCATGWLCRRSSCPPSSSQRQSNASQTLCDIVRLGREQGGQLHEAAEPDPLLAVLES